MKSTIFFFVALATTRAYASDATAEADCTPRDFSARFGPHKNQGPSELCPAITATDLLTEALQLKPSHPLSVLATEAIYISMTDAEVADASRSSQVGSPGPNNLAERISMKNQSIEERVNTGGFSTILISQILKQGKYCTEREMPSQARNEDLANFVRHRIQQMSHADAIEAVPSIDMAAVRLKNCDFNDTRVDEIRKARNTLNNWAAAKLRSEVEQSCKRPISKNLRVQFRMFESTGSNIPASSQIGRRLDAGRPVGIGFDSCKIDSCDIINAPHHEGIIVARKWDPENKTCLVKIRNSWGSKCAKVQRPGVRCENGDYWIGLDVLTFGTVGITTIERDSASR